MQEIFEKIKERLEEEVQYQQRKADETPGVYKISQKQARQKMRECYDHAIEIVNQVAEEYETVCNSTRLNDGWIACSERLPNKRDWYLAVFKEGNSDFLLVPRVADYVGAITKGTTYEGWLIIDLEDDMNSYYRKLKCVAWRPLPAPYQPKGE